MKGYKRYTCLTAVWTSDEVSKNDGRRLPVDLGRSGQEHRHGTPGGRVVIILSRSERLNPKGAIKSAKLASTPASARAVSWQAEAQEPIVEGVPARAGQGLMFQLDNGDPFENGDSTRALTAIAQHDKSSADQQQRRSGLDRTRKVLVAFGLASLRMEHERRPLDFRVISLSLRPSTLTPGLATHGTLPAILSNLQYLRTLSLPAQGLVGTLPPSLGLLTSSERINLSGNSLSGFLPSEWSHLQDQGQLDVLDLSSNELVGQIPHTWFTVPYTASGSTNYTSLADTPRLNLSNNAGICQPLPEPNAAETDLALPTCDAAVLNCQYIADPPSGALAPTSPMSSAQSAPQTTQTGGDKSGVTGTVVPVVLSVVILAAVAGAIAYTRGSCQLVPPHIGSTAAASVNSHWSHQLLYGRTMPSSNTIAHSATDQPGPAFARESEPARLLHLVEAPDGSHLAVAVKENLPFQHS
ncbi:hypothetical protein WJX82_004338 [Trebouxia sp. C0006]